MATNSFIARMKATTANTGSRRMIFLVGAAIVAAVAYAAFSTPTPPVNPSTVAAPPPGTDTRQGAQPVTPAYEEALSESDRQRIEEARSTGGSALPTVRASTQEQITPIIIQDEPEEAPPPAVELPRVQPPVVQVQQPVTPAVPIVQAPPPPPRDPEAGRRLADAMYQVRRGYPVAEVTRFSSGEIARPPQPQAPPAAPPPPAQAEEPDFGLPAPGQILYAQMVSRANSDAPGPVLAQVLQGEFAGATLIGSFQTARDALLIQFTQMTFERDGETHTVPIRSVAVDTAHIGTALATSVDRHLFQKLAIGFTASFAQGFGQALAGGGTTRVITEEGRVIESRDPLNARDQLLAAGGQAVAETGNMLMNEFGRRPTTVIVESGTPVGILFL